MADTTGDMENGGLVGFDPTMVARALESRQMLVRAPDGFLSVRKIEGRSKRVYVIKPAIISEEGCE